MLKKQVLNALFKKNIVDFRIWSQRKDGTRVYDIMEGDIKHENCPTCQCSNLNYFTGYSLALNETEHQMFSGLEFEEQLSFAKENLEFVRRRLEY